MSETSVHDEPVPLPSRPFGRVVRSVLGYAVATAVMLVSPAFVFIPAALFHCGIRNGRAAAWLVLVLGTVFSLPYFVPLAHVPGAGGPMAYASLAALILGIGVPALATLPLIERAESFGRVLMSALVASVGGLALTEMGARSLLGFSPYLDQVARAKETAVQVVAVYQKAGIPSEIVQTIQRLMGYMIAVLPSWFLIDIALVFVLSMVMLGRLRTWREYVASRPETPRPVGIYLFRNLSLPEWLLFAFVIGGITPFATGMLQKVAANVLAVVTFLYLLQGLAIVRSMLATAGAGIVGVLFGFLLLVFLTITGGLAPLLLSIAGLFDSFFDFRHFKRKDDSHESHTD
jgi:hypothetical protein